MIVGRETTAERTLDDAKDAIAAGAAVKFAQGDQNPVSELVFCDHIYPCGRRWSAAYRERSVVAATAGPSVRGSAATGSTPMGQHLQP